MDKDEWEEIDSSWNYRIIQCDLPEGKGVEFESRKMMSIGEVYYKKDGSVWAFTFAKMLSGEPKELKGDLRDYQAALKHEPVTVEYEAFWAQWTQCFRCLDREAKQKEYDEAGGQSGWSGDETSDYGADR